MMEVILEYKREVDKSTGRVLMKANGSEFVFREFKAAEFKAILTYFADALREYPDAKAVIQRTDRAGLVPYNLDAPTTALFRSDPVAAIEAMSTPYSNPSTTVKRVQKEREPIEPSLRVGFDTLADAFGEELYASYDSTRNKAECPCCGIWGSIIEKEKSFLLCINPSCTVYHQAVPTTLTPRWAAFSTEHLLRIASKRYFFPRAWNDSGLWVSFEDLTTKYEQFKKEKESCR